MSGSRSLGERLQSFTIECGVTCGLFIVVKFPVIPGLLSVYHERRLDLSSAFSVPVDENHHCPSSGNVVDHIDWFSHFGPLLHFQNKSLLVMVYNPFSVLLSSICWHLLRISAAVCIRDVGR